MIVLINCARIFQMYCVGGKLLEAVKRFYLKEQNMCLSRKRRVSGFK